jgi:chloramphenicol 3-O-phosphotransferase
MHVLLNAVHTAGWLVGMHVHHSCVVHKQRRMDHTCLTDLCAIWVWVTGPARAKQCMMERGNRRQGEMGEGGQEAKVFQQCISPQPGPHHLQLLAHRACSHATGY